MRITWVQTSMLLLLNCSYMYAAGPPPRDRLLQGGVTARAAFVCLADRYGMGFLYSSDFRSNRLTRVRCSSLSLFRWHVRGGVFWLVDRTEKEDRWGSRPLWDGIQWYALAPLLNGQRVNGPTAKPDENEILGFSRCTPPEDTWSLAEVWGEFPPVVHYDIAPTGRDSARLFLLTNVGGRFQTQGATDLLVEVELHMPLQDRTTPRWSFTCYATRSRWDPVASEWKRSPWKPEFSLEVGLREAFHALSKGEDYYFLTESGRLFRAARPIKGTFRKMETTYAERDRPVAVFLTDADNGRVFLFRHAYGVRGKPAVAELAPRLAWREYDPALYRPGSAGPTELRRVVGYARVLQALGLVKTDPLPSPPK